MTNHRNVQFRVANVHDIAFIRLFRAEVLGWGTDKKYTEQAITQGHAVVAEANNTLVGVRYQRALAPDTLGDGLLAVHPDWRRQQIGSHLIAFFEETADKRWKLSIVINSDLFQKDHQVDATSFWLKQNYLQVISTGPTRLFHKTLQRKQ